MKWFRFWTDTLDDVKILQLSDYEYRIWTYLLAIASEVNSMSGECHVNVKSMSLRCRTQVNHFLRALETFQRVGLITIDGDGFPFITNWKKRQFKSDDVTARVRKHREVTTKRNVSCNVSETDQITDTDTDTEKDKTIKKQKIVFADGKFKNIPENLIEKWRQVAPGINVMTEIPKAELWVISNPQKGRSQWIRFLSNWMVRAQNNFIKYGGGDRNGREFRTNRTDPRDKTLQSREDIEIAAITAKWEAHKKAARDKTRRTAGNDDAPDFASKQITR